MNIRIGGLRTVSTISLVAGALFLSAGAPVAAGDQPINAAVVKPELPAFDIASTRVMRLDTIDGSLIYRIEIELGTTYNVEPFEKAKLPGVVEYEIRTESGEALGGGSFDVEASRTALEEGRIVVLSALGGIKVGSQDEIILKASPSLKAIRSCEDFCDSCADLAEAICTSGVAEFSCGCDEGGKRCSITCDPGHSARSLFLRQIPGIVGCAGEST